MAKRATQGFVTAANTLDGRPVTFTQHSVVPDHVAKALADYLTYDDGAPDDGGTVDGVPKHACADCDFVAKSAAGLGAHGRVHDE